jgi:hypothetical protein
MTVIYRGQFYDLTADAVTLRDEGGEARPVALELLPLPVARVLRRLLLA